MRALAAAIAIAAAGVTCASELSIGAGVRLIEIAPGAWIHLTEDPGSSGTTANGLLVTAGAGSLLIDTGWSDEQTTRILDWAEFDLGRPIGHVVVTHAHPDRWGGLAALEGRSIVIHGHAFTSQLARAIGHEPLHWTFEFQERIDIDGEPVELLYPGPAHARDNIVVYLPQRKLLFGGCMVRALDATRLGFIREADLDEWPRSLRRVIDRFRDVELVVPGHGAAGGRVLMSQTMHLLEQRTRAQSSTRDR